LPVDRKRTAIAWHLTGADHNCRFPAVLFERACILDDRDQRFVPQLADTALIIAGESSGKALVGRHARIPIRGEPLAEGKGVAAGPDHGEVALVAADSLRQRGWKIEVRLAFKGSDCSELTRRKLDALRRAPAKIPGVTAQESVDIGITLVELLAEVGDYLGAEQDAVAAEAYLGTASRTIILDGLLGIGAKPPLRDPVRKACGHINQLREKKNAHVFAVDLPTGLDGDSGETDRAGCTRF